MFLNLTILQTELLCLGAIISNEVSKPWILSRIAQTKASLSRLKMIWRNKNISLASTVKLMRTLILATFLYACESWTLTAEIERRIQALEMRCYKETSEHFLQRPCDERGGSQQNPECNWSARYLLTMVKIGNSDGMATSQDPRAWRRQFCR